MIILEKLKGDWIKDLHYFQSLPSTQDYAFDLAKKGAEEATLIIAERQTLGRGRNNKTWLSPQGGIWLSLILRPIMSTRYLPCLTLSIGLAITQALREATGLEITLRWPNDLYYKEKKLGGVLLETGGGQRVAPFIIAGIGINVDVDLADFPLEIREISTSLKNELAVLPDNFYLLEIILKKIKEIYDRFKKEEFSSLIKEIRKFSCLLDRQVSIRENDGGIYEGRAYNISENGALILRLESGKLEEFFSGELKVVNENASCR